MLGLLDGWEVGKSLILCVGSLDGTALDSFDGFQVGILVGEKEVNDVVGIDVEVGARDGEVFINISLAVKSCASEKLSRFGQTSSICVIGIPNQLAIP